MSREKRSRADVGLLEKIGERARVALPAAVSRQRWLPPNLPAIQLQSLIRSHFLPSQTAGFHRPGCARTEQGWRFRSRETSAYGRKPGVSHGGAVRQEVILALLAKEPAHGYELRSRLAKALGPLGEAMNAGQVYVALSRLEKAGLVAGEHSSGLPDRPDRKVYAVTADGQQRVAAWLSEVAWPRPDLAEFHLKLVAAAAARLADPLAIVDAQRRELLRRLRDAQRAAMAEPEGSDAALLLEGVVLRMQADLRWLEACERTWISRKDKQ